MARTRRMTGQYTPHNTPGDGTGLTHFPPKSPYDVLEDVDKASGAGHEHTNATRESVQEDQRPRKGGRL